MAKTQQAKDTKTPIEIEKDQNRVNLQESNTGKEVSRVLSEEEKEKKLAEIDHSKYTKFEGVNKEMIEVLRKTVCKDFSLTEIYFYLNICADLNFSPYLKLLWAWKEKTKWDKDFEYADPVTKEPKKGKWIEGAPVIFAGRDGFVFNAERNPLYRGQKSFEIREKDNIKFDVVNQEVISHTFPDKIKDRGKVVGAWCVVYKHGRPNRLAVMDIDDYKKSSWKNDAAMCKKVAEAEAHKKQFPLPGVQSEYDWELNPDGTVEPRMIGGEIKKQKEESQEDLDNERLMARIKQLLEAMDRYEGKDKNRLRDEIAMFIRKKEMTDDMLDNYFEHMENTTNEERH